MRLRLIFRDVITIYSNMPEDQLLIQSTPRGLSIGVRSRSKAGWRERRIERHGGDAIVGIEL